MGADPVGQLKTIDQQILSALAAPDRSLDAVTTALSERGALVEQWCVGCPDYSELGALRERTASLLRQVALWRRETAMEMAAVDQRLRMLRAELDGGGDGGPRHLDFSG